MSIRADEPLVRSRRALLSLGIGAALAVAPYAAYSKEPMPKTVVSHRPSAIHQVTNCSSSGPGSLSAVISDPMTVNNDVVDLTPLKMVCSSISVSDLWITQDNLTIEGPGAKYLSIDGGNSDRLFSHYGGGTLTFSGLTLKNGYFSSATNPTGGCLLSRGSVSLIDSDVSHCTVKGTGSGTALGGGVHTWGDLHLLRSTITDSHAEAVAGGDVAGGGADALGNFTALYSTINGNTVAGVSTNGVGGGVVVEGDVDIEESTISGNHADIRGALTLAGGAGHTATIVNSTISNNVADLEYGGIWTNTPLTLRNSTIAFNHSPSGIAGKGEGLYAKTVMPLIVSTIISGNSGSDGPDDLGGSLLDPSSHNNLIVASSLMLPAGTIRDCPKLDVLADNGGPTLTLGLNAASEAIDKGSQFSAIDQRIAPRVTGPQADIGAVEWQPSDRPERILASGLDGLCDQ